MPKADLTLIQSTPTEIRELNLNEFHLNLRDLEDDEAGMPFQRTHKHNTEVLLGGISYARVVEIINDYTVTFEDGQYAVNLVGANSNVGDRVNVNQVSVRSANSAGLISSADIEYSSFNGAVYIDITTSNTGTVFPTGTPRKPVNNMADALLIASVRGFKKLHIITSMVGVNAISGSDLDDFIIEGDSAVNTRIEIAEDADCVNLTIRDCDIFGTLDGGTHIVDCKVGQLVYVNGHIDHCGIYGDITLDGSEEAVLSDCYIIDQDSTPTIDMGGSGQDLAMPNYSGIVNIKNLTSGDEEIGIGLAAGLVVLEDTITAGNIIIGGVGLLYDYTTGTTIVNDDGLMNRTQDAYRNTVYIDVNTTNSGCTYPVGLQSSNAVNNIPDALLTAEKYNCTELFFLSDITVASGIDISNFSLTSNKSREHIITFEDGVTTTHAEISNLHVTGVGGCYMVFDNCIINNFTGICGLVNNCYFDGNNSCKDNPDLHVIINNSRAWDRLGTTLDVGQAMVTIQDWVSHLILAGKYGPNQVNIQSKIGKHTVLDTCISGTINYSGVGYVTDNSTGACVVSTDKLTNRYMQAETSADYVWDEQLSEHTDSGSTGYALDNVSAGASPSAIAQEVWSTTTSGNQAEGTFGEAVTNISGSGCDVQSIVDAIWEEPTSEHTTSGTYGANFINFLYSDMVYINTVVGVSGTAYPIGLKDAPVNNVTEALVIANTYNCRELHFDSNATIDSGTDISHFKITGHKGSGNMITLEDTCTTNLTEFEGVRVTGYMSGSSSFYVCGLVDLYDVQGRMSECNLAGTISLYDDPTTKVLITNCISRSQTPVVLDVGQSDCAIEEWVGMLELTNKTANNETNIGMDYGFLEVDFTCNDGDVFVVGNGQVTDNSNPGCTVDYTNVFNSDVISVAVWDELLTGVSHNLPQSAGRMLRALGASNIHEGPVVSGTGNTVILDNDASSADGAYDPALITITEQTGAGQSRLILQYDGATKTAVIDRDWKIIPDNTSTFLISAHPGREHINEGQLQAGTVNTLTLNTLASDSDEAYSGQTIFLRSGTGQDQACKVTAYDGTTKVATLCKDLAVIPDNTTGYVILPSGYLHVSQLITKMLAGGIASQDTLETVAADTDFIANIEGGKWEIVSNQMIFYASDNVTEVVRFNLYNKVGAPASDNVYKRVKV